MTHEYLFTTDRIFFKHERSPKLQPNTYAAHTHNAYELIYFLEGDATHVIEDRTYKLKKGDLVLIRPGHYHFIRIDSTSDYERYDLLFDPLRHRVPSVGFMEEDIEVVNIAENAVATDIFRKCDLYYRHCDKDTFSDIVAHLLCELFYSISLFSKTPKSSVRLSPLLSGALQYINGHLCEIVHTREIAVHLFVSESYLIRLFGRELHQTPKKYMTEKRLLLAQRYLQSGEAATAVAVQCGFADYTSFYRNYKAYFGYAPTRENGFQIKKEQA